MQMTDVDKSFEISINCADGQHWSLQTHTKIDLKSLKCSVEALTGLQPAAQQLLLGERLLHSGCSNTLGLQSGDSLTMIVRDVPPMPKELLPFWQLFQDAQLLFGQGELLQSNDVAKQCCYECQEFYCCLSPQIVMAEKLVAEEPSEKHVEGLANILKVQESMVLFLESLERFMHELHSASQT